MMDWQFEWQPLFPGIKLLDKETADANLYFRFVTRPMDFSEYEYKWTIIENK